MSRREQVPNSSLSLCIFLRYGFKMRIAANADCFQQRDWTSWGNKARPSRSILQWERITRLCL